MRALQHLVERLTGAVKREPSYRIMTRYTDRQLATMLWLRGWQLLRGSALWAVRARVRAPVLRGRRVVVEHAYQVESGAGLILEDGVCISALSRDGVRLGRNVTIGRGATLTCTGIVAELGVGIEIGSRSAVGASSFLGGQGGIRIGDDVIIGPGVRIFSENHRFQETARLIRAQGQDRAPVVIESDCWIGAGATILAGVTVGRGSVVAAGAVVTRSVTAFSVVAGVPARRIRSRQAQHRAGDTATPPSPRLRLALVPTVRRVHARRGGQ